MHGAQSGSKQLHTKLTACVMKIEESDDGTKHRHARNNVSISLKQVLRRCSLHMNSVWHKVSHGK